MMTKRVFIGVGHGGKDPGAVCLNQLSKQRSIAGWLKKGFDKQGNIERMMKNANRNRKNIVRTGAARSESTQ